MKIIALTQKGPCKAENEDRIIVNSTVLSGGLLQTDFDTGILAVADGVGGNAGGAAASHYVACRLSRMEAPSAAAFGEVNQGLLVQSASDPGLSAMATTLSAVHIGDAVRIYHVGNTRIYALRNRKYLKQLTTDDTEVNYLVATGQLTEADAQTYERRNVITACMGGGKADYFKLKVTDITGFHAPAFLLTSDGIHEYVSPDEIEDTILAFGFTPETCVKILESARQNGSVDDASVLLGVF